MDMLKKMAARFSSANPEDSRPKPSENARTRAPNSVRSAQEISAEVVELLRTAEKSGPALQRRVRDVVGEQNWTESIARAIVGSLETVITKDREKAGPVLAEAINKAEAAAKTVFTFSKANPYLVAGFATIVAIGVLALLVPWVVEALGFGELGPIAGTFASWWQSTYAGFVPKGSAFSLFQRLGATWGHRALRARL